MKSGALVPLLPGCSFASSGRAVRSRADRGSECACGFAFDKLQRDGCVVQGPVWGHSCPVWQKKQSAQLGTLVPWQKPGAAMFVQLLSVVKSVFKTAFENCIGALSWAKAAGP